jgi:small subunit ribosomal protein S1
LKPDEHSPKKMEKKLTDSQIRYFNKLKVGDIIEGIVTRITHYGAFLKIGSLSGLIHISEITWGRINEVEDFLKINQRINVKIIEADKINHQLKFSLKQTLPHPWDQLIQHYHVGDVVVGQVVDVKDYGAFIMLRPGLEGLIHISDVQEDKNGKTAHDFFKIDETYQVKIMMIDIPKHRMQLTLKDV